MVTCLLHLLILPAFSLHQLLPFCQKIEEKEVGEKTGSTKCRQHFLKTLFYKTKELNLLYILTRDIFSS